MYKQAIDENANEGSGLNTVVCGYVAKSCISLVSNESFMKTRHICYLPIQISSLKKKKTADSITPELLPSVIK